MRTPESWLKTISNLRLKHTALSRQEKWVQAQTVREKILIAWNGYHKSIEAQPKEPKQPPPFRNVGDELPAPLFKFAIRETTCDRICSRHKSKDAATTALRSRLRK